MSSGWFDSTKPSLTTSLEGKHFVQGTYALVRGSSSAPRTFLNYIIAERARCVEFFYMSSGWFDCTEPSLTTSLEGKQFMCRMLMHWFGVASASNLLEPS